MMVMKSWRGLSRPLALSVQSQKFSVITVMRHLSFDISLEQGHMSVSVAAPVATVDPKVIELTFWETIKDSTNPEMYEAYLKKYPDGEFVILAKAKLIELNSVQFGT